MSSSPQPVPSLARPGKAWAHQALVVAWRVFINFNQDRVMFLAGGVSFFTLLGVFPALAAFVSLYGLIADPQHIADPVTWLSGAAPEQVLAYLSRQMRRLAERPPAQLSAQFLASLALAIWSADAAVKALIYGVNLAYHLVDRRNFFVYTWLTLRLTLAGLILVLAASALVVAVPAIETWLGLDWKLQGLTAWRWPLLFGLHLAALWPLYRYGPCRKRPRVRRILPGAVLAAALSLSVSLIFSWYLEDAAHLDATYGPVGATVGFMLWTWLSSTAVLIGAELNGVLEARVAD